MAIHDLSLFRHDHAYDPGNRAAETRTWIVVGIAAVVMVVEIVAGIVTGSMALLADGWHMATHVIALGIAGGAYLLARLWSTDERFAFGTWKIEVLGAFSSALLLGVVAAAMIVESILHLVTPEPIAFAPALIVAFVGLAVNLASAVLLGGAGHGHDHGHEHQEHHAHDGHTSHDLNLRSAYIHVLADALTSVLAIAALSAGLWLGWSWLDPVMGLVGAAVVAWWVKGLMAESSRILLDREMDTRMVASIRGAIEVDGDAEIADLHVWRVGRASHAAVLTVVAHRPLDPAAYRKRLACIPTLMHVSVEVNRCPHGDCP
ncbi:MAG TPA: CDF family Co(II)/Ni(II) efflux transporter DmeF [Usitatibacter sp.]|nr:CDF family Co(II)/Ni(II) efflux transporter DmeF [Usitatibacter sp.]